jgi:hypothetical protein
VRLTVEVLSNIFSVVFSISFYAQMHFPDGRMCTNLLRAVYELVTPFAFKMFTSQLRKALSYTVEIRVPNVGNKEMYQVFS